MNPTDQARLEFSKFLVEQQPVYDRKILEKIRPLDGMFFYDPQWIKPHHFRRVYGGPGYPVDPKREKFRRKQEKNRKGFPGRTVKFEPVFDSFKGVEGTFDRFKTVFPNLEDASPWQPKPKPE